MRAVCCPPRKKNREKEMRIKVPLFHLIGRQQAISVLGSVIKQCCGKITRADQTAHEANGKSRHGYALALVSSHDVYFFVFFFFFYVCVDLFMVCLSRTSGFFFFIFKKIKISKIYVGFGKFQKYTPVALWGGRHGSNVIFFFKFATKSLEKKKEGGLSPPQRATGSLPPILNPGYHSPPFPLSFEPKN